MTIVTLDLGIRPTRKNPIWPLSILVQSTTVEAIFSGDGPSHSTPSTCRIYANDILFPKWVIHMNLQKTKQKTPLYLVTKFCINLVMMGSICLSGWISRGHCNGTNLVKQESMVCTVQDYYKVKQPHENKMTTHTAFMRCVATVQSGFLMAMLCGVPIYLDESPNPKNSIHGAKSNGEVWIKFDKICYTCQIQCEYHITHL